MEFDSEKIFRSARDLDGDVARTLSELIGIWSPSRGEAAAIEYVAARMRGLGFDEVRVDAMGNLIGRIGSGPSVLAFDAHVDIVDVTDEVEWAHPPYGGQRDGDFIYGRGACDQKGAIASLLAAARLIKTCAPADNCTIYVAITVQEEDCEGLCWCHLIESEGLRPHAVVLTEPSSLKIARGQKGKVQMEVETKGVASHGSAPERGENAIYKMAPIIAGIEKLNPKLKAVPPLKKGTVVVSRVESSAPSVCSVPEACHIHLDRRMTAGETKEQVVEEIAEIAKPWGGRVSVSLYEGESYKGLKMRREEYYPAWLTPEDEPIVKAAVDAYRSLFESPGEVIVWDFSTNGVATSGIHGIPTIGFGPGDPAMAHVRDERVPVEHLVRAAAFYAALPSFFCRVSGR